MEWEFDSIASTTFPLYSRAVVGDLSPDPVTPLTASLGVGAEMGPAWARVYADLGLQADPYPAPEPEPSGHAVAMFGAHLFLNTSLLRLFGKHASGADPVAFTRQYLGERPDVPRQRDGATEREGGAEQLQRWADQVLDEQPDRAELTRLTRRAGQLRAGRPDLPACSTSELATRITAARAELRWALRLHARAELATALVTELLTRTAEEAGEPTRTGDLIAGLAGTGSGEPAASLWELGRQVRASDRLQRLFDQGVPHAANQLVRAGNNEVGKLRTSLTPLFAEHGHHGPGGWELGSRTWDTEPRLVLRLLETLRQCPDEREPGARAQRQAAVSAEATVAVRAALSHSPTALARFESALAGSARWLGARRRLVDLVSSVHHEQRLAARELGRRVVETGLLDDVDQIFMLLAGELAEFVTDPDPLAESLRMRAYDYYALATYKPPFVTVGQPPPVVRWPRISDGRNGPVRRGITGTGAAPGQVSGPVRVLRSPSGLLPGEVLVARASGPGWLPILAAASAAVIDDGAALSEVAIACRDLGIPCVVACIDATMRLTPGQEVVVDGSAGTVRLESTVDPLPGRSLTSDISEASSA
jgi:pyruvate,water dikinase